MRFAIALLLLAAASAAVAQPNIVLIMADDLGFETIGAYGSTTYRTPHLDRLAARGVRFKHAYSQPLCTPSRVQLMTGQYNHRNYTYFGVLPKGERTFAHILKGAGYDTLVVGKWQLLGHGQLYVRGEGFVPDPDSYHAGQWPSEAGFDDSLLWQVQTERQDGERFADPVLVHHDRRVERYPDRYGPDLFVDHLEGWLNRRSGDSPFFIYFPMALTHDPFVATPDSAEWKDDDRYKEDDRFFVDMVEYMDKLIGRIVAILEKDGTLEDTVILFTGDNGNRSGLVSRMRDGRTIVGAKGRPTDAGTRVPLIVAGPGVESAGRASDALIDFSDFLPTLAAIGDAPLPQDRTIDGKSFLPVLADSATQTREWIFCDYRPRWASIPHVRFARDRRFKLYDDGRFYDVANDGLEESPLNPTGPVAQQAHTKLSAVLASMQ